MKKQKKKENTLTSIRTRKRTHVLIMIFFDSVLI